MRIISTVRKYTNNPVPNEVNMTASEPMKIKIPENILAARILGTKAITRNVPKISTKRAHNAIDSL